MSRHRWLWIGITIAMVLMTVGAVIVCYTGYNYAYASGYANGTHDGYTRGHTIGYQSGQKDGYDKGKSDGYSAGYSANTNSGYSSGYAQGQTDQLGQMLDWQTNGCTLYSNGFYQIKFWRSYDGSVKYTCLVQSPY